MTAIPANVIFLWTGTNASIPSGWSRETTLDAKYPKGTAAGVDPGGTGGALTHSHTTNAHRHNDTHTHTTPDSSGESGTSARDSGTTNPPAAHTHVSNPAVSSPDNFELGDTPATDSVNHEPPFLTAIFIKSDGTPTGLPDKAVGLWNNSAATPTNWNLCDGGGAPARPDMRNRWAKGAATSGDGGSTGGATTHTHAIVSHSHTGSFSHSHTTVTTSQTATALSTGTISGTNALVATATHKHTLSTGIANPAITGATDAAAADNSQPPYWVLAWIQNNAGALDFPDRIIGLWLGTLVSIPTGWKLCDGTNGTPDLRSLFVKGANTLAGIGGSGGSLTHGSTHTATGHTHPVAGHTHTLTDAGNGASENRTAGSTNAATNTHTHTWANTGSTAYSNASATPTVVNYTDTQPPFVSVAFIQWQASVVHVPIMQLASAMGRQIPD